MLPWSSKTILEEELPLYLRENDSLTKKRVNFPDLAGVSQSVGDWMFEVAKVWENVPVGDIA